MALDTPEAPYLSANDTLDLLADLFDLRDAQPFLVREGGEQKIVTLCGSSRFVDVMAVCAWLIERDEKAIAIGLHLLPRWYPDCPGHHLAEAEGVAAEMDALHLRKIEISDEIFVVDVNGYIGKSTSNEIAHATKLSKPIRRFSTDAVGLQVAGMLQAVSASPPPSAEEVELRQVLADSDLCAACDDLERSLRVVRTAIAAMNRAPQRSYEDGIRRSIEIIKSFYNRAYTGASWSAALSTVENAISAELTQPQGEGR